MPLWSGICPCTYTYATWDQAFPAPEGTQGPCSIVSHSSCSEDFALVPYISLCGAERADPPSNWSFLAVTGCKNIHRSFYRLFYACHMCSLWTCSHLWRGGQWQTCQFLCSLVNVNRAARGWAGSTGCTDASHILPVSDGVVGRMQTSSLLWVNLHAPRSSFLHRAADTFVQQVAPLCSWNLSEFYNLMRPPLTEPWSD